MGIQEELSALLPAELHKLGLWHRLVWVLRLQGAAGRPFYLYLAPAPLNAAALEEHSPGEDYPEAEEQLGTFVLGLKGQRVKKAVFHPETSVVSFHFADLRTLHLHCAGGHATLTDSCGVVVSSSSRRLKGGTQYTPPPDRGEAYVWQAAPAAEIGRLAALSERQSLLESARRLLGQLLAKAEKKRERVAQDLESARDSGHYRRLGELLKINYHLLGPRMEKVTVQDVFGGGEDIEIKLVAAKSPAENVTHYFTLAEKAERGREQLEERLALVRREVERLGEQLQGLPDMASEELAALLKAQEPGPKQPPPKQKEKPRQQQGPKVKIYRCVSSDGFHIIAGRNAEDNDYVTMRLAQGNDGWLHVRDYPGSHAIIRWEKKRPISPVAWREAAELCAALSKAPDNSLVDVIYTYKKHVSKPRHAKPGLVMVAGGKNITVRKDTARNKLWLQSHFADGPAGEES